MISKSKGQVLRLAAILATFFVRYDVDAVISYESARSGLPNLIQYLAQDEDPSPIPVMAMDASISLIMFSVAQTPNIDQSND